jgi:hypothetical protein
VGRFHEIVDVVSIKLFAQRHRAHNLPKNIFKLANLRKGARLETGEKMDGWRKGGSGRQIV